MKDALKFRLKLLVAMMLVVAAVTSVTLYLAEKNLRDKQRETLALQFQNQLRSHFALQQTRFSAIKQKCLELSHSVRLRAALEERDADDLYRNAITELRDVLRPNNDAWVEKEFVTHASFVRFIDPSGTVLPARDLPVGAADQPEVEEALQKIGSTPRRAQLQTFGFIALGPARDLTALRQIVVTKIVDWNNTELGALVLGFPLRESLLPTDNPNLLRVGIFLGNDFYFTGGSEADREVIARRISAAMESGPADDLELDLPSGPYQLFYKPLTESDSAFEPAYEVCLFPLSPWLAEVRALRWKIISLGAAVLAAGLAISILAARGLAKPVDQIVAGSEENLARRQEAEQNLRDANRELEKALAELKATQRQVIQQERLRALGQMASGIAHDFNNTLTPILGFSELLLNNDQALQNTQRARRFLEMLHTSARDAANVVARLREFYRPAETNTEFPAVDLGKIVQQAISLTEPKWKNQAQATGVTIEVEARLTANPLVAGEEAALREVLTNLIFNSVDALPAGGRIVIESDIESDRAVLRVRDNGTGMTEHVRQRCLEPFFSTKGERGTGLGLSMVYGIIERHRGRLEIESVPGQGTTFVIRLPLSEPTTLSQTTGGASPTITHLRILVVDDDERVCEVVGEFLRGDGHEVVIATNGREAVAQVSEGQFDVVFLDRAMPEMSGDQAAELMKQIRPQLPIILLTGFGALIEVTGSRPRAIDAVLGKPVTISTLRETIDKLLHAA